MKSAFFAICFGAAVLLSLPAAEASPASPSSPGFSNGNVPSFDQPNKKRYPRPDSLQFELPICRVTGCSGAR